jgi:hypothetical protein
MSDAMLRDIRSTIGAYVAPSTGGFDLDGLAAELARRFASPAQPVAWQDAKTALLRIHQELCAAEADDYRMIDVSQYSGWGTDILQAALHLDRALRAASPAPKIAPATEGLVTVPREPTEAMIEAGLEALREHTQLLAIDRDPLFVWRYMIAAASPSPAPVEAEVREALGRLLSQVHQMTAYFIERPPTADHEFVNIPNGELRRLDDLFTKYALLPTAPAQPGAQNNDVGVGDWNDAIEAARRAAMSAGADEPSIIQISAGGREAYLSGATASERSIVAAIERLKR